ncbi:alkaline phosphatase [Polaribacter filamentus]|uniref:Alkaline phosphatase n=1 Tax=Polaribacter filamentus TaxID=53483 RepID=A0A2S7L239_9FLAO|nr:alkaline phosphatase [Polaribacter filamentus]PQB08984.1 alkaline phosphatase [Polaribacter filamentus]
MHTKAKFLICLIFCILFFNGCKPKAKENAQKKSHVKNVILLIGDGMGVSQISTAFYFNDGISNFKRFNNIGFIRTSSASHLITDSAAGATAFSTGKKTYNGAIGMNIDSLPQKNIVEVLSKKNLNTGLIATSSITHATPASFFAHVKSRELPEDIATWLPISDIDYFAAGGLKYFNKRKDSIDYLKRMRDNGFIISLDSKDLKENLQDKKKYGFLLAEDGMPKMSEGRGDFLISATDQALSLLSNKNKGFFLMIEGSQIDWGGHNNDADYIINEVKDFDNTIGKVLDFAEKDGNTLVVIVADHETGGFTLASSQKKDENNKLINDYNNIKPSFSTKGHSATLIPVFAFGPKSDNFRGVYENSEIYEKILNSLNN